MRGRKGSGKFCCTKWINSSSRYETPIFQKKVKSVYEALQEQPLWKIVDADKTEEQLQEELMGIVENKMNNLELETPASMW